MSATKNINAEKIQGSLTADTINIQTLGSGTSVTNLGIDSSGNVVTGTTGGGGDNFYVTGFTYDDTNTFTISRNGGLSDLTSTISVLSGITYYGDGSNITGVNAFSTFSSTTIGQGSVVADNSEDLIIYSGINLNVLTNNTNKIITFSASTDGGGSSVATDPIWDVEGDLVVATGADAAVRIPIGSDGTFLRSNSTTAAWSTVSFPNDATTGDILYASTTNNYDNLSPGTAGHVLTSNGAGVAPSYQATGGEANIGNNVGGGNEVFKSKTGTSLNFRTFVAGPNISITSGETTLTISGSTGGGDNFYVTGFTYDDANTLTISRNGGLGDLSATINTLTGLTINGVLSASTYTGITLNDLDDVTTNIPATPDNTYQGRQIYFDVTSNQWLATEEYGNLGTVTIWGKKGSAGTIDKGCPVYITGFDDDIHEVELANATTATTMPVIGFTGEDFDDTTTNPIITFGKISGLDTTSTISTVNPNGETWAVNDVLYMNTTDGGLTKNRPSGTNTQIQRIAKVLKVDATSGQLFIFNTARTAGLPNLTTDYLWLGNGNDTPQEVIRTDVGITTTGFTYNDNNTFTITDDNGGSLSTTFNQVSGLTINGDLDVTGDTILNTLTATSITSNSSIDVFNGHINLRDNSYFLQGRTVGDSNVSLIGVDSQDRVFVGNAGYDTYIHSDAIVDGSLTATTLNIATIGGTTPITNLGIDTSGNVVSGDTGVSDANKVFSWFMNVT